MGSDSSKHVQEDNPSKESFEKMRNRRQSAPDRRPSVSTGKARPPTIRIGSSISCNEGLLSIVDENKQRVDRPEFKRNRSGSASSDKSSSIKVKHPVPIKYRQLIQSCFLNPHEAVGRKILKRTAELRSDFAKFYVALNAEQKDELEESIKFLLKKTVCNVDFLDEVKRMAEEFGERFVQFRVIGFKADFFSTVADATIKECTFLDNAIHPAHQTLNAFSQFITMVFTSVRDGYYNEMRRLRRTSNSFSTSSNGSSRRKKPSVDSFSNPSELALPSRSVSPSGESRYSDECFTPTIHECDEGFLKPPTMVSARN